MQKQMFRHGGQADDTFIAQKQKFVRPAITGTKVVGGETFYVGKDGKLYRIALFDAMFNVVKSSVKIKGYKGVNPNKKHIQ